MAKRAKTRPSRRMSRTSMKRTKGGAKTGCGTLILTNSNTYLGATDVH